jgi:hypothetical protein
MNTIQFATPEMCVERMVHYAVYMAENMNNAKAFDFAMKQYRHWEWMLTWHSVRSLLSDVNSNETIQITV